MPDPRPGPLSVRTPDDEAAKVRQAAASAGVAVNAWILDAIRQKLESLGVE